MADERTVIPSDSLLHGKVETMVVVPPTTDDVATNTIVEPSTSLLVRKQEERMSSSSLSSRVVSEVPSRQHQDDRGDNLKSPHPPLDLVVVKQARYEASRDSTLSTAETTLSDAEDVTTADALMRRFQQKVLSAEPDQFSNLFVPQQERLLQWYREQRQDRRQRRHECYPSLAKTQVMTSACLSTNNVTTTESSLLMITGPSGSGKSQLALTLAKHVEREGGYFLRGKCDLLQRLEPFPAFTTAFSQLPKAVDDRDQRDEMRAAILAAVGHSRATLTEMFPALNKILGPPSQDEHEVNAKIGTDDSSSNTPVSASSQADIDRFIVVFRMLLGALVSPDQPLVILLEDLHWADQCSLIALSNMVTEARNADLFLIGTADPTMTSGNSYLSIKLREIQLRTDTQIVDIQLSNFDQSTLTQILSSLLSANSDKCSAMACTLLMQTQGNLLYVKKFLKWLFDSDLLYLEVRADGQGEWGWDLEDVVLMASQPTPLKVFLSERLNAELSPHTKEALMVATCLGWHVDEHILGSVLGSEKVQECLDEAVEKGVLRVNRSRGGYIFSHDEVQEAMYMLIADKELFHLEVGRRLWRQLDREELDMHVFTILSQFRVGAHLITRENERLALADLCVHAGAKAAKASTFRAAVVYLRLGIYFVGEKGWRDQYDLTLTLHNMAAEMQMCTSEFEKADDLIDKIVECGRNDAHKVQAYNTRMYIYGVSNRQTDSIDLGLQVLQSLGEPIVAKPSKFRMLKEMKALGKRLQGWTDSKILLLPALVDENKMACLRTLQTMYLHAVLARPMLAPLIISKCVEITLDHGLCALSSSVFSGYSLFAVSFLGDVDEGQRFANLSITLFKKFGTIEYLPRVYAAYYGVISPLNNPIHESLSPLLKGYRVGLHTGDFEFAVLCAKSYCSCAFGAGVPLETLNKEWKGIRNQMLEKRTISVLSLVLPTIQAFHHLMGLSCDPLSSKGDLYDYEAGLEEAERLNQPSRARLIRSCRIMLAYLFGDYELASRNVDDVETLGMPPVFEAVLYKFFHCLTSIALVEKGIQKRANLASAKKVLKMFDHWATLSPFNYLGKEHLLKAELHSVLGRKRKAMKNYIGAIAVSQQFGFTLDCALSNERAAWHFHRNGQFEKAVSHFRAAVSLYEEWNGKAKAAHLRRQYEALYAGESFLDGPSCPFSLKPKKCHFGRKA